MEIYDEEEIIVGNSEDEVDVNLNISDYGDPKEVNWSGKGTIHPTHLKKIFQPKKTME